MTDDRGLSAITWACTVGNLDIVKILLKSGAAVSLEPGSMTMPFANMRHAYQIKCMEEAKTFLGSTSRQPDHSSPMQLSVSPLMASLYKGHEDIVLLLIEAGADWSEVDHWCDQTVIDEPRMEPVLRKMIGISMLFDDFKAYGPFGAPGTTVNSADVGNIPRKGTIHAILAQFSLTDRSQIIALQFIHMVNSRLFPCKIHHTTVPHAGDFDKLDNFSHVERLILEDNEYVISAELGIGPDCVSSVRFTTNYRVCKWLGVDPQELKYRVVTVAPSGREIVGLFTSVGDRFFTMGFLTRLRMGDFAWRTLRTNDDDDDAVSNNGGEADDDVEGFRGKGEEGR